MNSRSIFNLQADRILRRLYSWDWLDLCAVLISIQITVDDVPSSAIRSAVAQQKAFIPDDDDGRKFVTSVIAFLAEATLTEIAKNSPAEFLAFYQIQYQPHGWPEFSPQLKRVFVLRHLPAGRHSAELITSVASEIDRLPRPVSTTPLMPQSS